MIVQEFEERAELTLLVLRTWIEKSRYQNKEVFFSLRIDYKKHCT